MAEAIAAAYGYGVLYSGIQNFYAGAQAGYAAYQYYRYFFPEKFSIDDSYNSKGEFTANGNQTKPKRRRRYVRRRYYRRY